MVFTEEDNKQFLTPPTKEKVTKVLYASNLMAAPGTDGIPGLLYKEHWDLLGDHLSEVMLALFHCNPPTCSMLTSLMVFGAKPKKPGSILPKTSAVFLY